MSGFHEIRFPFALARGAAGGPVRRTEVTSLASGAEARNGVWAGSRRRWEAGPGITSLEDLQGLIDFFEARRGRLYGFRFRDPIDHASTPAGAPPGAAPSPLDQAIGVGDGAQTVFQLSKAYESGGEIWRRKIAKPVAGSVRLALDGTELAETSQFSLDAATGRVTLDAAPPEGAVLTAGFEFDCPARFDSDVLDLALDTARAGRARIAIIEILV